MCLVAIIRAVTGRRTSNCEIGCFRDIAHHPRVLEPEPADVHDDDHPSDGCSVMIWKSKGIEDGIRTKREGRTSA